jgi:hypothetical protein
MNVQMGKCSLGNQQVTEGYPDGLRNLALDLHNI